MPQIPTPSSLKIPPWLDEHAPLAADAVRLIANDPSLSTAQRHRIQRLASKTRRALTAMDPNTGDALSSLTQHDLITTAFRAVDLEPVGKGKVREAHQQFNRICSEAEKLVTEISRFEDRMQEVSGFGEDPRLTDLWLLYRRNRTEDALVKVLPGRFVDAAKAVLERTIIDFHFRAAPHFKPQGPARPLARPNRHSAKRTAVIHKLADVLEAQFGAPLPLWLHDVIAIMTDVSMKRDDTTKRTVKYSLKSWTPQAPNRSGA